MWPPVVVVLIRFAVCRFCLADQVRVWLVASLGAGHQNGTAGLLRALASILFCLAIGN